MTRSADSWFDCAVSSKRALVILSSLLVWLPSTACHTMRLAKRGDEEFANGRFEAALGNYRASLRLEKDFASPEELESLEERQRVALEAFLVQARTQFLAGEIDLAVKALAALKTSSRQLKIQPSEAAVAQARRLA